MRIICSIILMMLFLPVPASSRDIDDYRAEFWGATALLGGLNVLTWVGNGRAISEGRRDYGPVVFGSVIGSLTIGAGAFFISISDPELAGFEYGVVMTAIGATTTTLSILNMVLGEAKPPNEKLGRLSVVPLIVFNDEKDLQRAIFVTVNF
jgi:hypothetical protein